MTIDVVIVFFLFQLSKNKMPRDIGLHTYYEEPLRGPDGEELNIGKRKRRGWGTEEGTSMGRGQIGQKHGANSLICPYVI